MHWFAGIGCWEYALRLAGWGDREVWTGSCPCQPYSLAGNRKGDADERNLWPAWFNTIRQCRPATVFGEQVAPAIRFGWLDRVFADLEGEGYACGSAVLGAHSVGAPHIRQRLFWVAYSEHGRQAEQEQRTEFRTGGDVFSMGNAGSTRLEGGECERGIQPTEGRAPAGQAAVFSGHWDESESIACRDGKARRVESGIQCLVDGFSFKLADGRTRQDVSRAKMLKVIGNAIVPQLAAEFIRAFMEAENMTAWLGAKEGAR